MGKSTLKIDYARIKRDLVRRQKKANTAVRVALNTIGKMMTREATKLAPKLSGELRRRIVYKTFMTDDRVGYVEVGVGVPDTKSRPLIYAEAQDIGKVIKPVRAQKLAFPVHPSLFTKSGVSGVTARQLVEQPEAFNLDSVYFTDRAIMGEKDGHSAVFFVRKRQVTIPAEGYLQQPLKRMANGGAKAVFKDKIENALSISAPGTSED